jgi:glycosyltransferase involved in cell wall biosynthesis
VAFGLGNVCGRLPLALADRYVALGPRGRRRLVSRGVDADRVTILPPSIDAERFRSEGPSEPVDVPDERATILFVGRLSRLKGLRTLEAAIPRILDRRDDLQFVLVGDAESSLALPDGYDDHVSETGPVPPAAIPAYYQQADLLIHPSLTEGIPRVLLEALAAGTPVLARDVGDVATVTDNIFESDDEFETAVRTFESLPLDDVDPFRRETLRPTYRDFFAAFQ